jgi:hypothetical protein
MEKVQFGTTVLPETIQTIERLAKVEGKSKGELIDLVVAAYDSEPVIKETPEIPDDASVLIAIPRDRQMLIQAFANLLHSCSDFIHENEIWKAFAEARLNFQKALPEYQSAERMRLDWQARREAASRPLSYTQKGPSLK